MKKLRKRTILHIITHYYKYIIARNSTKYNSFFVENVIFFKNFKNRIKNALKSILSIVEADNAKYGKKKKKNPLTERRKKDIMIEK